MKIDQLVDRDYFAVSVLEDVGHIYQLLKERPCYVVMDEKAKVLGIVTQNDVPFHNKGNLKDKDLKKPVLSPGSSIINALRLMRSSENYFLPVFKTTTFIGTISIFSIAEYLLEINIGRYKKLKEKL